MAATRSAALATCPAADVVAAMPPVEERLALAERTMTALVADAELPPEDRRPSATGRARSRTRCRRSCAARTPTGRTIGWASSGSPGSAATPTSGLPADQRPRRPQRSGHRRPGRDPGRRADHRPADGRRVRASRSPGSGRRAGALGRTVRAALIGAGVQGHSHLEVLGHVLPGVTLRVFDRDAGPRRTAWPRRRRPTPGIAGVTVAASAREARRGRGRRRHAPRPSRPRITARP